MVKRPGDASSTWASQVAAADVAARSPAGWEVAEDDGSHVQAHRDGRAFDVMGCPGGGIIWAESDDEASFGQGNPAQAGTEVCPRDL